MVNEDRKSTRLNSSHTEIYTLSLHDALPIFLAAGFPALLRRLGPVTVKRGHHEHLKGWIVEHGQRRSEEHTSELQSHRDLHSFPTRRSSDLPCRRLSSASPAPWASNGQAWPS